MAAFPYLDRSDGKSYWAGTATPYFDEFVKTLGRPIEARIFISVDYIGKSDEKVRWPIAISPSHREQLIQVPALGRTHVALRSKLIHLTTVNDRRYYMMEAGNVAFGIFQNRPSAFLDREFDSNRKEDFIVMGRLGIIYDDSDGRTPKSEIIIHRFESLQLDHAKPDFGQWFSVDRYGDLGSDPDVVSSNVLVGQIEIPYLR